MSLDLSPHEAQVLQQFVAHHRQVADTLVELFDRKRQKMRDMLENPLGTPQDHINAGKAQAYGAFTEIFKKATVVADNELKRNRPDKRGATGAGSPGSYT